MARDTEVNKFMKGATPLMRQAEIEDAVSKIDMSTLKDFLFIWIDREGNCKTASNPMEYAWIFNLLHHAIGVFATLERKELDGK